VPGAGPQVRTDVAQEVLIDRRLLDAPLRITAKPSPSRSATERNSRSIGERRPRGSSNVEAQIS
jgi:hypothetical protein